MREQTFLAVLHIDSRYRGMADAAVNAVFSQGNARVAGSPESVGAPSHDDRAGSLQQNLEIGPDPTLPLVEEIEAHHLIARGAGATGDVQNPRSCTIGVEDAASLALRGLLNFELHLLTLSVERGVAS